MNIAPSLGSFRASVLLLALPLLVSQADPIPPARLNQGLFLLVALPQAPPGTTPAPAAPSGGNAALDHPAAPQLRAVRAVVDRQAVTLALDISGEFDYFSNTSSDRLLLVDFPGLASREVSTSHLVDSPWVSSYRVVGYLRGEQPSLRLEVLLKGPSLAEYRRSGAGLEIRLTPKMSPQASPAAAPPPAPAGRGSASFRRPGNRLEKVGFTRHVESTHVQLVANGSVDYKAFALANPDRVVLDIPNVVNGAGSHPLLAEGMSPLRLVRAGQFQKQPPITRVVLELDRMASYDVRPSANGLEVELRSGTASRPPVASYSAARPLGASASAHQALPLTGQAPPLTGQAPPLTGMTGPSLNALLAGVRQIMPTPKVELASSSAKPASDPPAPSKAKEVTEPTAPIQAAQVAVQPRSASPPPVAPVSAAVQVPTPPRGTTPPAAAQPAPAGMAPQPPAKRYTGEPISINVKDVDIKDFFRLIHEISGLNVVLDPGISGRVTMVLDDVPWDQALDIVLRNFQLDKVVEGNVLRIALLDTFKREQAAKAELAAAEQSATERITYTAQVNYAKAEELAPTLRKFLSPRADIIADARTNQLIITDIPQTRPTVDEILRQLDRRTQQVEIEARVVAATREFVRELGSQFGFATVSGKDFAGTDSGRTIFGGNPVGDNSSPIVKRPVPPVFSTTGAGGIPLLWNFPAAGANVGTSFIYSSGRFALDEILTAAERKGIGKLLSRPRIITQNNRQGLVQQGVKIPVQTTVNNTVSVQFVDVTLKMTVTPQVTGENTIFMQIDVTNSTIDPGIARINGIPALDTQQTTTQVLVDNGGTIVFGGVITNSNNLTIQQVPLLGSIPIFGNLFRRTGIDTRTTELIFFITPRIV